jgi:hypothetical protein
MLKDHPFNFSQDMFLNPPVPGKSHRCEPELTFTVRRANVDVRRLIGLVRVEMESKCTNLQYRWHSIPSNTGTIVQQLIPLFHPTL